MSKHDKDIVSALRSALAARIGEDRFGLWFGTRVQFQVVDHTLRVTAGDRFILDRVRNQFRSDVEVVGAGVLPGYEVEFHIDGALTSERNTVRPRKPTAATHREQHFGLPASAATASATLEAPRRPSTTLEDFVVGDGNRLAYTAAISTVRRLGHTSPLFVYGPTGCGKSFLLDGIATNARQKRLARRIVSLSAEQFTSLFLEALQGSGLPSFRRKYRDVELLLVDDVQFLCGKRATIVEFQYTVDALLRDGRQLVLSADRPPAELNGLGQELAARISGGLVCALEQPDLATRWEIARRIAKRLGRAIPDDVLRLVATHVVGDARQLAGAIHRLHATSEALSRPISIELAETALSDIIRATQKIVRLSDIETAVCQVFAIDSESLQSERKSKLLSQPRMLAMWLARKYTRAAYSEIGEYFGGRSHSTVISAQKKVDDWVGDGASLEMAHGKCPVQDAIRRVEARLRAG